MQIRVLEVMHFLSTSEAWSIEKFANLLETAVLNDRLKMG
jgi:hypothetical protein